MTFTLGSSPSHCVKTSLPAVVQSLGYLFDAATNKALTLAARTETRDYVDIVELAGRFPLAAICWAACGEDPGFTPLSLLKMMRFARIDPAELDKIQARALDPIGLKARWLAISDEAEVQMTAPADERPDVPIGVAFVDASGMPSAETAPRLAINGGAESSDLRPWPTTSRPTSARSR